MKKIGAALLLIITTMFWGVTFTVVKEAVAQVDVFVFLAQRFTLATALMIVPGLFWRGKPSLSTCRAGLALGIALFASYAFQTAALLYTSASNTGFLTGLNVVFVPILGALAFRLSVPRSAIWGVCLSAAGLYLLCTGGTLAINRGDLLGLACAVCTALHILLTGRFAPRHDVYWLTTIQLGFIAIASSAGALLSGQTVMVYYPVLLWPLLVCALFASIFAFLVQTAMQRHISPANTALIFCLEPVFAAAYAYLAAGERLTAIGWFGAVLILAGMLIAELLPEPATGNREPINSAATAGS
ncbi:MAG TPA: DMT family transporter [Geobacteraceae bacterium]